MKQDLSLGPSVESDISLRRESGAAGRDFRTWVSVTQDWGREDYAAWGSNESHGRCSLCALPGNPFLPVRRTKFLETLLPSQVGPDSRILLFALVLGEAAGPG